MSQISPPIRILGLCAIGLIAAWFVFLKPGEPEVVPAAAPPANAQPNIAAGGAPATTGVGSVAEAANDLKANADAKTGEAAAPAAAPSATAATQATTGAETLVGAEATKAAKQSGLPLDVMKAIAKRKVMVLFFWNPAAADDQAVNRELRDVTSHRKGIFVKKARIKDIARYGQITRGADVTQVPTIVVVDRKLQAEALPGYTDHASIEQAIDDARRAGRK